MIDVTDMLDDLDLKTIFTVTRRLETVSAQGRSQVASTVFPNQVGVICVAHGNDLDRLPEADLSQRHISIVTKFRLRIASVVGPDSFKPDEVAWQGNTYIVLSVEPYPEAGPGFVQAIAASDNIVDVAP